MLNAIDTTVMRLMTTIAGLRSRLSSERGQDLLEYALLGGLIAAAITGAAVVVLMTGAVEGMAAGIGECIDFDDVCP